ncbi:MAG: hypothetical protein AVDCRST_MAG90-142, partial [uncultured Microvirga sp.]
CRNRPNTHPAVDRGRAEALSPPTCKVTLELVDRFGVVCGGECRSGATAGSEPTTTQPKNQRFSQSGAKTVPRV